MLSSIVRQVTSRLTGMPRSAREATADSTVDALAHLKKLFDHSSRAARIGVWECDLKDERLAWTDMVYELFDLPLGHPLDRNELVKLYSEKSLAELTERRSRAIRERDGFSLDAEIITAKGNHRWIRITATVECEGDTPVRIFGMKQDITAEKKMFDEIRHLAEFDMLTDLPNRTQFQSRFQALCAASASKQQLALFLIDLDGFKQVNDRLGHQAGDQCLIAAGRCLRESLAGADLIARIGGDEFAVLHRCSSPDEAERIAGTIVTSIAGACDETGRQLGIGASVGVALAAGYAEPKDIFAAADGALYDAKSGGRNRYCFADPRYVSRTHAA
ncbi:sensor domain-containing diguanylate cyclase [Rhizobium sp. S152]|uniref:sensor domain-containing diguanylate cyclase n=1 Tax=Rhizobium sp. S152 TaxID=3055038 RepID=UPI0025A9F450|nr:sensor domain-containing diguanylate cyclase [Rhizobium sp. S152]MDM9625453.1 sensor domain-containing diguanylate cyclase [Rhizobium sp. S152]